MRSKVVPANVARSIRQSRNTVSVIVPRVHCAPVSRAPVTTTRRSDSSGAARLARLPRSTATSASRRPGDAGAAEIDVDEPHLADVGTGAELVALECELGRLSLDPWRLG